MALTETELDSRPIPLTVWALGAVSFFTDVSSEMIYPLMPAFLAGALGASAAQIGLIEGLAETTASLLKIISGAWADRSRRRKPLVLLGYGLSGAMRPLIGLAPTWLTVLGLRFTDRIGKGIRSAPRDALIADVTPPNRRGAAFGIHRAMDHAGAVVGPLLAMLLLNVFSLPIRHVFLWAALPALLAMFVIVYGVREKHVSPIPRAQDRDSAQEKPAPLLRWSALPARFKRVLLILILFTLGNSTDAFLLLRLNEAGVAPGWIASLWAALHVVKMTATTWGGRLADRVPRLYLMAVGWLIYAMVYVGFARISQPSALIAVFLSYGLYFGLTEPAEKAWVADSVPAELRGTAFGYYHLAIGIGALPASLLFGAIWKWAGSSAAFLTGAALAAFAAVLVLKSDPPTS